MKNEEIVKALRCCAEPGRDCEEDCPMNEISREPCREVLAPAAADLIEKLTDRCARYAEEIAVAQDRTRWIPVTERLPEDRSNVLVVAYWYERWGVHMGWCAPERAEWSVHVGIGDRSDVAVVYWMPLPEPPEVER